MTPDELKNLPKGQFIVMKTGTHPMQTRLRLFLDWGITFEKVGYQVPERSARKVAYANKQMLMKVIREKYSPVQVEKEVEQQAEASQSGGMAAPMLELVERQERTARSRRSAYNIQRREKTP